MSLLSSPQLSPSVLSADFSHLGDQITSVVEVGAMVLHLDIMDGNYVPNLTFGPLVVKAIRKMTDLQLEAHLMISNPDKYIEHYISAGAGTVLVHPSTCISTSDTLNRIHDLGAKAGLVVNPDEKLSLTVPYLEQLDQVLIMSVFPGFGGQTFIPEVLDSLEEHRPLFEKHEILVEIDGGINSETIQSINDMGIDRFVAGSAIFNTVASPGNNYLNLLGLITRI